MGKETIIYAVGDVGPKRKDPDTIFDRVRSFLKKGDIGFCQLETNLSTRGTPLPQARLPMRSDPSSAEAIENAGFHVVSFAGNHCMDWGQEAFFDTIDALKARRLAVVGVGKDIDAARTPVVIEKHGVRIAFLAYNTILPMNYWAETDRPGCAPLRALTVYEPVEQDQPGTPPRIHTTLHGEDLFAMEQDIRKIKKMADIVILSMHWGIHFVPAEIAAYQKEVAHRAIDAGADLLLGHHPHILKGIEVYKGKAIFYSLGNFAIEQPGAFMNGLHQTRRHKEIETLNPNWDHDGPYSPPPETRMSMIVKCTVSKCQVTRVGFVPVEIDLHSAPEMLTDSDPRFSIVAAYLRNISNHQGLCPEFAISEEEVTLKTAGKRTL